MDRSPLSWALLGAVALLGTAAIVVVMRGVSPPYIPPPEPFTTADEVRPTPAMLEEAKRRIGRPGPRSPTPAPDGAWRDQGDGLRLWDIGEGQGAPPEDGQVVAIDFVGWLDGGTLAVDSYERPSPTRIVLGAGQTLPGIEAGIRGMRPGGRRQLQIPARLAFGEAGLPGTVAPDATLLIEILLVYVLAIPDAPPDPGGRPWKQRRENLRTVDLIPGSGRPLLNKKTAVFDYAMWVDGQVIDTSWDDAGLVKAELGAGLLVPGWDRGMVGMRPGGRRLIEIPPALAFGDAGKGTTIPPGATILVDVTLRRVE